MSDPDYKWRDTQGLKGDATKIGGVVTHRVPVNAEGKPICGAKKKNGALCMSTAGYGTDHNGVGRCKWHMGNTIQSDALAARQEALAYYDKMVALGQVAEGTDPDAALMEEVARAQAAVEYFDEVVKELTDDPDVDQASPRFTKIIYHWNEQRRILTTVASLVVKAGISRRAVEIQEMQAAAVLTAVLAVIGSPELALDPEKITYAKRELALRLRDLSTTPQERVNADLVAAGVIEIGESAFEGDTSA